MRSRQAESRLVREGNLLAGLRVAVMVAPRNPSLPSRCDEGPKRVEKQTLVIGCGSGHSSGVPEIAKVANFVLDKIYASAQ